MNKPFRLLPPDPEIGWTPWAWLIYLIPFVAAPFYARVEAWYDVVTVVASLVFLALYFIGYWVHGRRLLLVVAAITLIGCLFLPTNPGAAVFFIYAASFAAWIDETPRTATIVIAVVCALLLVEGLIVGKPAVQWAWGLPFAILIGALNVHHSQTSRLHARLRLAQHEVEHLAKVAERERIARDMHDVVGHTLSLIVLKSELASKLADRDPARAVIEIRGVEAIAREALSQVRAAVRGYRSAGLTQELESARENLTTAGMEVEIINQRPPLNANEEGVLSLALREAITNVLRHSGASRCSIRVDRDADGTRILNIRDNGRGGAFLLSPGQGLQGMKERVDALGGSLSIQSNPGTEIEIRLPPPLLGLISQRIG